MERLTYSGTKEAKPDVTIMDVTNKLSDYEDTGLTPADIVQIDKDFTEQVKELEKYRKLGYTPDEIKLVMNPPEEIWLIDGLDNDRDEPIYPVFPVGGEQLILCDGFLFNCQDEFGDYQEVPVAGLGTEYFITIKEAIEKLKENDNG